MTFTVMCGLPCSGKTTKANELAEQSGATLIRLDDYTHFYLDGYKPQDILSFVLRDIGNALERGEDVIYDAVNATADERRQVIEMVGVKDCRVVCIYMQTPVEICVARDKTRWAAIFAQRFEPPTETEGFELIDRDDGAAEAEEGGR